ncbi:retropepsin-like aspartic protease [Fictibacillus phosphorivorans]|uniref:retropepsin-like aspartic protease n=1 Tax=Fictibacillus phosphorivorans TaxID=1221500 RepID=UPI003CF395D6
MNTLEGLKTFRFHSDEMNREFTDFASALEFLTEGKESLALKNLKHLYNHAQDISLRSCCAQLLFTLYYARSNWEQIELLDLLDEPSIVQSNKIIAKTRSQHEKTMFSFQENPSYLPMTLSLTGCPTITAKINGKKVCLWLDTGAEMTVLSHSLAQECGVSVWQNSGLEVENSSSKSFNTDFAFIDSIELGNCSILNQPSLILKDDFLRFQHPKTNEMMMIDGIIGWDIIQHIYLEIDYVRRQVLIQKPHKINTHEHNLFFCGSPIVKAKGENDIPLFFGLDTGANKSHFDEPLLSKIDNLKIKKRVVHAGGLGDVKKLEVDTIENLNVCLKENQHIQLHNVRKVLAEFATFFKLDGILGSDIAKEGRLVIDYVNGRIELSH